MKSVYILFLFFLFPYSLLANHIAGGELTVTWISGNTYQITLTLYRDCSNPKAAPFDTPAYIDVWDGNGTTKLPTINIGNPTITAYQPNTNELCLVAPPDICLQIGVYTALDSFPPRANGYILAYETCCRNTSIVNIPLVNRQGQGAIYTQNIPDSSLAQNHSSPYFNNTPPIVICADNPFTYDCSATSPDGDSLAYSLYNPFTATLGFTSNPPFKLVQFNPGYSYNYPLGASVTVNFDSITGQLSFFPTTSAWYVIGICVREYKNGVLLDTHYRDVEFSVVLCNKSIYSQFNTSFNGFNTCAGSVVNFVNQSTGATNYTWKFGDGTTSTAVNPSHIYPEPGVYTVTLIAQPGVACTDSNQEIVQVYPYPAAPNIDITSPACTGKNISFSTDTIAGATYSWSGPNNFVSTDQDTSITNAQLSNSGIYALSITVNGCTTADSINATVNESPAAPALATGYNVCEGNNIDLSAPTAQGASYLWTGPDSFTSVLQNPTIVNAQPADSGIYSCVISVKGCTSPAAGTPVDVIPIAEAKVSSNTPLCTGQTLQFKADSASGVSSYSWAGPNNWTSTLPDPSLSNIILADSGIYTLTLNGNNGCSSKYTLRVVVVITPPLPDVLYKSPLCTGDTLSLSVPNTIGGTYYWTGPNNWTSNDTEPVFNNVGLTNSGIYSIYLSYNGCTGPTKDSDIVVTQTPAALNVTASTPLCAGVTLNLLANNIANGVYEWSGPNNYISSGWDDSITNAQVSNSGIYTANVTVNGCPSPPSTAKVVVFPIPVSTFNATPTFMCGEGQITATDADWKSKTAIYNWTYAGGALKHAGNDSAIVNYLTPGNYSISLQVEDNNCFSPINTIPLIVAVKPVAAFTADTTPGCGGDTVLFSNLSLNGNSYLWNFGNGDMSSLQNPSEIYIAGNYKVELTVTNPDGCSDSIVKNNYVIVYPIPVSTFNATPSFMCGEGQVTATDPDWKTNTAIYNWTYTGGALIHAGSDSAVINYLVPGDYNISLQVEDHNCFSTFDSTPLVVAVKPVAAFSADTTIGCTPDTIHFSNLSVNGNSYLWNFGNGDTSSLQNPSEIYKTGSYIVELTVINSDGCSDSIIKNKYITINPIPVSTFNVTPTFMCGEGQVLANGTGWESNTAIYSWTYLGGTLSKVGNDSVTINYLTPGSYSISLQIEDNNCFSPIDTSPPVVVGVKPVATFKADTTKGCGQVTIQFNNLSKNGNSFVWSLGNGDTSSLQNPSGTYSTGTYSVSLTVLNSDGCSDSLIDDNYITILPTPVAKFSVSPGVNTQILLKDASFNFTNESENATQYVWYFDHPYTDSSTQSNPFFMYKDTGNFYPILIATNEYGCSDTAREGPLLVEEGDNYFVPNTFTPNGDGKNDVLYLYGYHIVTSSMQIYDRWGAEVFSSPDPLHTGWDGTFKGMQMDPGVYVYSCTITTIYGRTEHVTGSVTLLR